MNLYRTDAFAQITTFKSFKSHLPYPDNKRRRHQRHHQNMKFLMTSEQERQSVKFILYINS